jgi:hypothetical protein
MIMSIINDEKIVGRHSESIPKFTPYTLTANHMKTMYNSSKKWLEVKSRRPIKAEVCINRSQKYLLCSGCKESLVLGDCVVRYGSQGHFVHYPICYNRVFVGSDEEESSSITPDSISPSSTTTDEAGNND